MIDVDAPAKDWDSDPKKSARAREVSEAIREAAHLLLPAMTAGWYASGTGLLSFALQPYRGHITLADSSPGMLTVLTEKVKSGGVTSMTPISLDLATDPLPLERYHLICILMTCRTYRRIPNDY